MLETEEDMLAYFDVDFGHAINATYIRGGVSTAIKIILNSRKDFKNKTSKFGHIQCTAKKFFSFRLGFLLFLVDFIISQFV